MQNDKRLTGIVPSERQLAFQRLEFYAFVHFTVNTFTDKEWGDGTESPDIFDPVSFDAEQWVKVVISAGMRGLILTCKHHDGFCLWDTRTTVHNVMNSPFGRDIVREVSDACNKHGIRFGVYLSPWDRNSSLYGKGREYDDFFILQLTELLTNYGDIFSVWFDGACGEGPNGKKQYYDWERYYAVIRKLQPGACISVCGPDVRWCGNEAGHTRAAEWSVVPKRAADSEIISEKSQHEDSEEFRQRRVDARDTDLGSRQMLKDEQELIWYPAEVNTSIRPGWFWHESENDKVKSLRELADIYIRSVGGNCTFLLNIPPTTSGLFHENDVRRLAELGIKGKKAINWSDSVTDWQYDVQKNEITISRSKPSEKSDPENNMKMLDSVTEGYDVKLKSETDQAWYFVCTKSKSNTKKDDPKRMDLVISKATYLPISVQAKEKGVTITMRNFAVGVKEKDITFNPADYPSAKIIDNR